MFSPANARAMSAYRQVGVQSMVDSASPQQLIKMLFDGLLASINAARGAIERGDINEKVRHIGKAVRILQEGLLGALDREKGGELAGNLASLYEYCTTRLTLANARNDASMVDEVAGLVSTVAQGWNEITNAPAPAAA
ncbi:MULTISPECIES: flagellar export chaperone FliS [Comamonas]|uniref:Flagellar secretion chaperone FliS n=1 Tax=Comamonas thiooxydans TaxID=363952 RepID=A0A096F0K8_9BURK|nr:MULTISPECIES: flagellar export chaperone FliS [Comamonas]ACY31195.1 flagellar protein FliS [Comamonas thiooxydans]KGG89295.1 flagellar biosynthesis protein FliS [Comamonas thiooxydans]KGG94054.1 flagellar biosynthesis protein FliS [Comamonas thiooxydans]KGG96492.1 flagellar biosynthesis protein FliS [Comamonas thiooxydans]KGH01221.1 flagellar biosynthesis protein FliS [Comamonas thiooxydans]